MCLLVCVMYGLSLRLEVGVGVGEGAREEGARGGRAPERERQRETPRNQKNSSDHPTNLSFLRSNQPDLFRKSFQDYPRDALIIYLRLFFIYVRQSLSEPNSLFECNDQQQTNRHQMNSKQITPFNQPTTASPRSVPSTRPTKVSSCCRCPPSSAPTDTSRSASDCLSLTAYSHLHAPLQPAFSTWITMWTNELPFCVKKNISYTHTHTKPRENNPPRKTSE